MKQIAIILISLFCVKAASSQTMSRPIPDRCASCNELSMLMWETSTRPDDLAAWSGIPQDRILSIIRDWAKPTQDELKKLSSRFKAQLSFDHDGWHIQKPERLGCNRYIEVDGQKVFLTIFDVDCDLVDLKLIPVRDMADLLNLDWGQEASMKMIVLE